MACASGGAMDARVFVTVLLCCVCTVQSYFVVVPDTTNVGKEIFDFSFNGARHYRIDSERTSPFVEQLLQVTEREGRVLVAGQLHCDGLFFPNPFVVYVESWTDLPHHVDFTSAMLRVYVVGSGCDDQRRRVFSEFLQHGSQSAVSVSFPSGSEDEELCLRRSQFLVHFRDLLPAAAQDCQIVYRQVSDSRFAIEPAGDDLISIASQCIREPLWKVTVHFTLKCSHIDDHLEHKLLIIFHRYVAERSDILSRIRREMSNQSPFFSRPSYKVAAPEDREEGYLVTTLTATDPEDDPLTYSMVAVVDSRSQNMFSMSPHSGLVTTRERLDREHMAVHHFQVKAVDSGSPPRTATATLQIVVQDANDHAPVFEKSRYVAAVRESITLGSTVLTVRATDSDEANNAKITYSILNPHGANEAFHMDSQTGIITARLPLDRESQDNFLLTVQAADQALPAHRKSATAEVVIDITDDNDNYPQFSDKSYVVQVPEDIDASGRPVISHISATDMDSGENAKIRYAIIGGNTQGHFSIDPSTGHVSVNKPLDYETVQKYRLVIRAQDGGLQSRSNTTNLLVNIADVNDNAPRFYSSHFQETVQENVQQGYAIVRVQAYDRDDGRNAKVRYSLEPAKESDLDELPFSVDEDTGWLRTRRVIDREQRHEYQLRIVARDMGEPPLSASASVTVRVQDQNDNSPVFQQKVYEAALSESAAIGTPVLSVTATDPDDNERLSYELTQGNVRGRFSMTSQNGVGLISLVQHLDFKLERYFVLKVVASDSGGRMDSATVYLNISDANTHPPAFQNTPYSATVYEDAPVGSRVLEVLAADQDSGENARITYTISGAPVPEFSLNPTTGEISTAQPLDRERRSGYLLTISARDNGSPSLSDTTDVEILVADVNDNAPRFSQRVYQAAVSEAEDVGTSVVTVSATDADQGLNGRIRFTFEGGDDGDGVFSIDPSSGQVRTKGALDREKVARYSLLALAVDQGSPEMTSSVEIQVDIGDINDSPPIFEDDKLRLDIKENSPIGSFVGKIRAHDPDAGANALVEYSLVETSDSSGFELRSDSASEAAELYTRQELDFEADKKVYILVVLAQSPPLQSYVTVEVQVVDVNDNAPQLADFKVVFNNYKNSFPLGAIGRVPAIDADVTDQLVYTVRSGNKANLVSINNITGEITLSSSLNTNVPKTAKMEVSVTDGLNEVTAELELHVRLVTDNMLFNSVTVRLAGMTSWDFLSPQIFSLFTDGLSAILSVPRDNIIIFSILDDFEVNDQILNVSFSALSSSQSGQYISQHNIRENVYLKRARLVELATLQVLPFDDSLCVREPCVNYEQCLTVLKFGNASGFIESSSILFRPIYPTHISMCRCPKGFASMREYHECDVEVDLCYSQPCQHGGTCVRREGGYSCVCAIGFAGVNCELDMGHGSCPSEGGDAAAVDGRPTDICRGASSCTNLKRGGFLCDNCVSSPYHSTFCELTGRSFTMGSFLTFPSLRQRHRFNIRFKFTTRADSGLLLYNGRFNELHDFIALELVRGALRFSFSVGGAPSHVTVGAAHSLSDGAWHHVEVDYLNRTATLVLDDCDRTLSLRHGTLLGGYHCANSTSMALDDKCLLSHESCQRFLDLTGPLQVGGLPSLPTKFQVNSSHFSGCIKDMLIDHTLLDFNRYVAHNNTVAGCSEKQNFCTSRPCQHGGTCTEAWGTFRCTCTTGYTGKRCQQVTDSARKLRGDGYISYSVSYEPVTLPWFAALGVRTRDTDALLMQLRFSDIVMQLQIEYGRLVYTMMSQRLVMDSVDISDGEWHHVQVKWMEGEVWISVDYGLHELTRPASTEIKHLYVEQVLVGGPVEQDGDVPGLSGCVRDIRVGGSLDTALSVAGERGSSSGCAVPDRCQMAVCPRHSVCEDTWDSYRCRCLPGYVGEQCLPVCQLSPCENNATCTTAVSDPRGYNCQCSSELSYGDYCQHSREQPCPSKWWGFPMCGPCHCDVQKGYDADCDKKTGACRCKANHYRPSASDVCLPCLCYSTGSYGNACDPISGQCVCRTGVIGRRCDSCSHPFAEVTSRGCQVIYTGCPRTHAAGVLWLRTQFANSSVRPCPAGSNGEARRACHKTSGWADPDLSDCLSVALEQQVHMVQHLNKSLLELTRFLALEAAADLRAAVVSVRHQLYVHDIYYAYQLLRRIIEHENNQTGLQLAHTQDRDFIPNLLESASVILQPRYSKHWLQMQHQLKEGAADLLHALDRYIATLARTQRDTYTNPMQVVTENIVLGLDVIERFDPDTDGSVPPYLTQTPLDSDVEGPAVLLPKYNNYPRPRASSPAAPRVLLPLNALQLAAGGQNAVVGYLQFRTLASLLPTSYTSDVRVRWGVGVRAQSPLLSLAVESGEGVLAGDLPFSYQLQMPLTVAPSRGNVQCVRWMHADGNSGRWTRQGCRTSSDVSPPPAGTNVTYISCTCNHLSSFAVLVDEPSAEYLVDPSVMEHVATYLGLLVSIVLLLLCFLIFCVLRGGVMHTNSNSIHKNLSFCLFAAQLLFLTALKLRSQLAVEEFPCKALAILQHYLWLSAFCWLLLESVHVHRMLTELRDVNHGAMRFYYTLGYGLPAVIVGLAVGVRADQYGNVFFCWLSVHEAIIWSMVGPVFILVAITLVNFVMAIRASFTLKDHVEGFGNLRSLLWLAVILLPLMGTVWVLSLLAASGESSVISFLLAGSAPLLGLYMLLGYCLLNRRVRHGLRRALAAALGCGGGKSGPADQSLSGTRTTVASRSALAYHHDEAMRHAAGGLAASSTTSRSTCKTSSSPYSLGINAPSTTSNSRPSSFNNGHAGRPPRRAKGGRGFRGHTSDSESEESTGRRSYSLASSHTSDDDETTVDQLQLPGSAAAAGGGGGSQLRVVERAPGHGAEPGVVVSHVDRRRHLRLLLTSTSAGALHEECPLPAPPAASHHLQHEHIYQEALSLTEQMSISPPPPPPPLPAAAAAWRSRRYRHDGLYSSQHGFGIAGPPATLSWMSPAMADRLSISTASDADLRGSLSVLASSGTVPAVPGQYHSSLSVNAAPSSRMRGSPLTAQMAARHSPSFGNGGMPRHSPSFTNGGMPRHSPSFTNGGMPRHSPSFANGAGPRHSPSLAYMPNESVVGGFADTMHNTSSHSALHLLTETALNYIEAPTRSGHDTSELANMAPSYV